MTSLSTHRYNLDNLEALFREFLIVEKVAPITLKNYLSDLRHFFGWFVFFLHSKKHNILIDQKNENDLVSYINVDIVNAYKTYLESNALPVKTINRRLSTIRKFCTLCIKQGWMKENPAKKVINIVSSVPSSESSSQVVISKDPIKELLNEFCKDLTSQNLTSHEINLVQNDIDEFLTIINY